MVKRLGNFDDSGIRFSLS